jgi:hypothetical protein
MNNLTRLEPNASIGMLIATCQDLLGTSVNGIRDTFPGRSPTSTGMATGLND